MQYLGRAGLFEAAAEEVGGVAAGRLSARGSFGYAAGRPFVAETLTDSFAIVDTSGRPDVAVYRDNHKIGVTDGRGTLVVANLPAYETAKFSIDPTAVDATSLVGRTELLVRPGQRVGVHVSFDIRDDDTALVTLVDETGAYIPAGAHARFHGTDLPVGFDGQVYIVPGEGGPMLVELPHGQHCSVHVPDRIRTGRSARMICRVEMVASR